MDRVTETEDMLSKDLMPRDPATYLKTMVAEIKDDMDYVLTFIQAYREKELQSAQNAVGSMLSAIATRSQGA